MRNQDKSQPQTEMVDLAESSTQELKRTTFTVSGSESDQETVGKQEVMHDNSDRSDASPVEADEQEEAWEDEEREGLYIHPMPRFYFKRVTRLKYWAF